MRGPFGSSPLYQRVLLMLLALPLVAIALVIVLHHQDLRNTDRTLATRTAAVLARSFDRVPPAERRTWLNSQVSGEQTTRPVLGIQIASASGAVLTTAGDIAPTDAIAATATTATGERITVYSHALDTTGFWRRDLIVALLFTLAGTMAFGIATWPAIHALLISIEDINHAVNSFRQLNFRARVREIGFGRLLVLEQNVNRMAEVLDSSFEDSARQSQRATDDLQTTLEEVEIKNVELDLARKRALADARDKSRFLANMSHEIRTPMNAIVGYSQMLETTSLDAAQHDYLERIERASQTLLTIIDDILSLSRLEAGALALESAEFDVRHIASHAVDMLAPQAYQKGLILRTRIEPSVPSCFIGDPGRIRQVLSNLLSNAIKFTDAGLVELHISADVQTDRHAILQLRVRDTGRGIDKEERQKLFEPFVQSHRGQNQGGAGLGLAIARGLVNVMGGTVSLKSTRGQGSVFGVRLPLKTDPARRYQFATALNGIGVLVAMADPTLRTHIGEQLRTLGAKVTEVPRWPVPAEQLAPKTRFVILESAADELSRQADRWKEAGQTPLFLVSSADRQVLQDLSIRSAGLALP
ncbi:MAG: ATP-binding protein, partial [Pseudomonadota bacterium]